MEYYIENMFNKEFIDMYNQQLTDLWKKEYKPRQPIPDPPDKSNVLASHVFKKRKSVQTDELNSYLNSVPADYSTNVLQYWKVNCLFIIL